MQSSPIIGLQPRCAMSLKSMTGFARVDGADATANWYWEIRSVNGRGLDVRLRLPPGSERLEVAARERATACLSRGNVSLSLNQRKTSSGSQITINDEALAQVLKASDELRVRLDAPAPSIEGLLSLRGVLEVNEVEDAEDVVAERIAAQLAGLEKALEDLVVMRAGEGLRLMELVEGQLKRIAETVEAIAASPARRPDVVAVRLKSMVDRLVDDTAGNFDEARLYQEAVLLAGKADVEEELQRLRVHVTAARELLGSQEAVGRRLDFLTQEFNREANTICSKSNDSDVTRLGLELKSVIEQMREQVQNIE